MSLKNMLKNGMIVKYRKGGNRFYSNGVFLNDGFDVCNHIDNYTDDLKYNRLYNTSDNLDIVKIYDLNEYGFKLVWERPKEILDKAEKEYLSAVIKPFRDRVEYIIKRNCIGDDKYNFCICLIDNFMNFIISLYFKNDKIYKNMELYKEYTLEELGL